MMMELCAFVYETDGCMDREDGDTRAWISPILSFCTRPLPESEKGGKDFGFCIEVRLEGMAVFSWRSDGGL